MSSSEQASHTTYADAYRESMDQPEKFWLDAARAVDWDVAPTKALDDSAAPIYRTPTPNCSSRSHSSPAS